jgi:hypothetical protein
VQHEPPFDRDLLVDELRDLVIGPLVRHPTQTRRGRRASPPGAAECGTWSHVLSMACGDVLSRDT